MKAILITGASGGIGAQVAIELASPGCSLFLQYYKNKEGIKRVASACEKKGAIVTVLCADLTRDDGDQQLLSNIDNNLTFHTIIHNAGLSHFGLFSDITDKQLAEMMNIHLLNPMKLTRGVLPNMVNARKGKIIVISSIWGLTGASCEVMYSAAKGGINSFVKGLAKELAPSGIQVNAIAPGAIETDMLQKHGLEELEELKEEIPAHAFGQPRDVAHAVAFLSSDKANYINGQILSINGAWYC
ncbi:SDR family oxidoreductase [Alkalihalobacillus sp. MEB130]|uniref:elongation factor P 5-aminopentanone reductase n=1 Tax=Alkalihalobacillus sp. MEB130 TaxID=2976704 RepID=UPI0028DEE4D0|nr:SDR family NAD(P)-dependent oxidoreductase [Alkalihalobacillus sp. MEB130]MDT8858962.1 SDR family oxidoreductase [Alkalihalobacillus sp. MEB130]